MIIAEQIRLRLKDAVPGVKFVGGATQLATVEDSVIAFPSIYVYTLNETGGNNDLATMAVEQRRQQRIAIAFAVQNKRDAAGDAAMDDLQRLRLAVDDALTEWAPNMVDQVTNWYNYLFKPIIQVDPLLFSRGNLVMMKDTHFWWQDEYVTSYLRRA